MGMGEWLTTGQVIDRLKRGDLAESCDGHTIARRAHGEIVMVDENNHLYASNVVLVEPFLKTKWRILPNYVSFEEAMKALKEGKTVLFHQDDIKYEIERNTDIAFIFDQTEFTFEDLIDGNWTIEEDNNESK